MDKSFRRSEPVEETPGPYRAIILTALEVECRAILSHLSITEEDVYKGTIYHVGTFSSIDKSWAVAVAQIGAGNDVAALETERAIDHFNPNVALFVGVAGGIKDVKEGDVVAATDVYGYESGKAGESFKPRPEVEKSTHLIQQCAKDEAMKGDWLERLGISMPNPSPEVFVEPIVSGEKVLASKNSEIHDLIKNHYCRAVAVETEGHGFLRAISHNSGVEGLVIRGISDCLDNKSDLQDSIRQEIAARHAGAFAFEILAKISIKQNPQSKKLFAKKDNAESDIIDIESEIEDRSVAKSKSKIVSLSKERSNVKQTNHRSNSRVDSTKIESTHNLKRFWCPRTGRLNLVRRRLSLRPRVRMGPYT